MSRFCVSMVAFHLTSRLWTRSAPLNATRRFLTREPSVILCGQTQRMWTPGLSVLEGLVGSLAPRSLMRYAVVSTNKKKKNLHTFEYESTAHIFVFQFVHINNLKLICRAHQLVHEGYKFMFDEKLVTVWSAPNYCYRCGNIASIMVFKDVNRREPKLFRAVPDSERVIPPRTTTPYFL